jgi:hypothetical protein
MNNSYSNQYPDPVRIDISPFPCPAQYVFSSITRHLHTYCFYSHVILPTVHSTFLGQPLLSFRSFLSLYTSISTSSFSWIAVSLHSLLSFLPYLHMRVELYHSVVVTVLHIAPMPTLKPSPRS